MSEAEELALVQSLVDHVVDHLVALGLRRPGTGAMSGYLNNVSSNVAGAEYFKCADQAAELLVVISGDSRFRGWEVQFSDNDLFPPLKHVTAHLTSPAGRTYTADPWRGTAAPFDPSGLQQPRGAPTRL